MDKLALQQKLNERGFEKVGVIQSLWSGYGEIARYRQGGLDHPVVVKQVVLPEEANHPRGWNTQVSHLRKVDSYHNEASFYELYSALCPQQCRVPACVEVFHDGEIPYLVMEDLHAAGFDERRMSANLDEVKQGLIWLAWFHARFMTVDTPELWTVGTYWHLATRQDEWHAMEPGALKEAARDIDAMLNHARFQTLLHGDAKLANFCFSDGKGVAAVDFQYVGRGVGVKDVMYFLGSCFDAGQLRDNHQELLDFYFGHLEQAMGIHAPLVPFVELKSQWQSLICFAWADFQRFLTGWSPEHKKINPFMLEQTRTALQKL